MKIICNLRKIGKSIIGSYKRFPVPLIIAAISGILLIALNETRGGNREDLTRIIMVLMMGFPITLALHLLWEKKSDTVIYIKAAAYVAAGIFLIIYYFFFLKTFGEIEAIRYIILSFVFYLIAASVACWFRIQHYEIYIIRILSRLIITGVFACILYMGVAGILGTIHGLLEINVTYKAYLYSFYIIAAFFVPSYGLAGVPDNLPDLGQMPYPKSLGVLLMYIMIPIISVYTVILYMYFIKMIIEGQWPEGMVGNLVLWYSIVSTVVIFFLQPLLKEKRLVKCFVFCFTKLIIPCLVVLFISVGIRVRAYGITESRYFVFVAALWVLAIMVYWSIKGDKWNIILPVSLAVVLVISSVGPLSAFKVSLMSQTKRLMGIAYKYHMVSDGMLNPSQVDLSNQDKKTVESILTYINSKHSLDKLKCLSKGTSLSEAYAYFGVDDFVYDDTSMNEYFNYSSSEDAVYISGYDYYIALSGTEHSKQSISFGQSYRAEYMEGILFIYKGDDEVYSIDMDSYANTLYDKIGTDSYRIESEDMTIKDENKNIGIKVVVASINGSVDKNSNTAEVRSAELNIYVKIK